MQLLPKASEQVGTSMNFVISTIHAVGIAASREAVMSDHRDYLTQNAQSVVLNGTLVGNNQMAIGTLTIIRADSLLAAVEFVENDPLTHSGFQESIEIVEIDLSARAAEASTVRSDR